MPLETINKWIPKAPPLVGVEGAKPLAFLSLLPSGEIR
jgi:hypothetical protein